MSRATSSRPLIAAKVPRLAEPSELLDRARRSRVAQASRALGWRDASSELRPRAAIRVLRGLPAADGTPVLVDSQQDFTEWLRATAGSALDDLDARADAGELVFQDLSALDDDIAGMLLTREFDGWPALQAFLPDVPPAHLQELWVGASGARQANQTIAFVRKLRDRVATFGATPLAEARVLDHGIGWGRIARHLARFVAPGELHGTDPAPMILDVCRHDRVPAVLHQTDFLPDALPVSDVDVACSFSVFTHISERATARNLGALHAAIRPGGLLVATVRPPAYADLVPGLARPVGAAHVFLPHAADPRHFQYDGGEMTYGEAIISVEHVREHWAPRFELLDAAPLLGDLHQVVLTLRRS